MVTWERWTTFVAPADPCRWLFPMVLATRQDRTLSDLVVAEEAQGQIAKVTKTGVSQGAGLQSL